MNEDLVEGITMMLNDAVGYAKEFIDAPKLKEYSKKVAAQDLLRKARKKIDDFNKGITNEYRKRKLEIKKQPKPSEAAENRTSSPTKEENVAKSQ